MRTFDEHWEEIEAGDYRDWKKRFVMVQNFKKTKTRLK